MDTLKSLAATTGTMHVLTGTYELLGLTNLSAQPSRRSVEVDFGRYRATVDKDGLAFKASFARSRVIGGSMRWRNGWSAGIAPCRRSPSC